MSARLSVIFYIILCLEIGLVLTFLPWAHPFGLGDWGDNYFLVLAARKTGYQGLQIAIASGWVRGAVTGLGMLNLAVAFWEMFHFRQTVRALEGKPPAPARTKNAGQPTTANHLSDNRRSDDARHDSGD